MTACTARKDYGSKSSGYVVKFADVSTSSNINNLSTFRNSGKFEVEVEGMYLISAWIFTSVTSHFSIRKNREMIATGYMSASAGSNAAATAVVAIDLKRNDEIWVQTEKSFFYTQYSTSILPYINKGKVIRHLLRESNNTAIVSG